MNFDRVNIIDFWFVLLCLNIFVIELEFNVLNKILVSFDLTG